MKLRTLVICASILLVLALGGLGEYVYIGYEYNIAYHNGWNDGHKVGYDVGRQEGYTKGSSESYNKGVTDGIQQQLQNDNRNTLQSCWNATYSSNTWANTTPISGYFCPYPLP